MVSSVGSTQFSGELERAGKTSARLRVPVDLKELYGRARPPLRVTIRGHTWRTTPGVYGGVAWIGLNKDVRAAAGVDAGDRVRVRMELDTEPRTVEVPDDLRSALTKDPAAQAAFDKLSFTHRREYVEWVEGAKRPETRTRRIAATVASARAGKHR
jgi:Bacteriocin-protection, YdeI or OmpD-Associated/Domain of unknown function (DUF1905)